MSTMQDYTHHVQCLNGHVFGVKPGTELEKRCKQRTQLDALCISCDECPDCIEEDRASINRGHMLDMFIDDDPPPWPEDSPYDHMLVGV